MGWFGGILLFVVAAQTLWLAPVILGDAAMLASDILPFRLPYHLLFGASLARGEWPSWTPALGGGMPLWHHPSAELANPTAVLFAFLPPHQALGVQLLAHVALTTVGTALLCRSLRVHPVLCGWAGLMVVACGPVAAMWPVKLVPSTALPWLLWGARLCARPDPRGGLLVTALATAFLLLHPDPPAIAGHAAAAVVVALGCSPRGRWKETARRLVVAGACAGLLAAPFLVPASYVAAHTHREDATSTTHYVPPSLAWLRSVAPGAAGVRGSSGPGVGLHVMEEWEMTPVVVSAFIGLTGVALLAAGAFTRRRSRLHGALGLGAFSLAVLSLGSTVPLTGWFWTLTRSRFPDKLLVPAAVLAILLAARLGTWALRSRRRAVSVALAATAAAGTALLLAAPALATSLAAPLADVYAPFLPAAQEHARDALQLAGACALVAALALHLARSRQEPAWLTLLVVAGLAEGLASLSTELPRTDPARLQDPAHVVGVLPPRADRLFSGDTTDPRPAVPGVLSPTAADDEYYLLNVALGSPATGVLHGASYPVSKDYSHLEPTRMRDLVTQVLPRLPQDLAVRLLVRLGATRLVVPGGETGIPEDVVWLRAAYNLGVGGRWLDLGVRHPPGVVTLEPTWHVEDDLKAATLYLAHPDSRTVVAETSAGPPHPDPDPQPLLHVVEHRASSLHARVVSSTPVLLVVREVLAPGWEATINDDPVPVHAVNLCQTAVRVPAGDHHVRLTYRTRGLPLGLLLGVLGALALAVVVRRSKRVPGPCP
jgi:hypothetical protein